MTPPTNSLAPDTRIPTRAHLSFLAAFWNAFFGVSAEFYPRIVSDGNIASLNTLAIMREMGTSQDWASLDSNGLDKALELARQSLNEVKSQTEYQDQKATRLLTITTFLTAFSGVLFTRFQDSYEFSQLNRLSMTGWVMVWITYALFATFILSALSGALVTFHATRTRFKYRSFNTAQEQDADPNSLEFFAGLIAVQPRAWLSAWVTEAPAGNGKLTVRADLRARYLHNLVSETYLVAAKTADKLRYLEPGQNLLSIALRCLFLWLVLLASVVTTIPAVKRDPGPAKVSLVGTTRVLLQYDTRAWHGSKAPTAPARAPNGGHHDQGGHG